jgi:Flp pilus assembly protein TadD
LLAAARSPWSRLGDWTRARVVLGAAFFVVAAFSAFTLAGNRALASAGNATRADHLAAAESHARRASSLQPWSAAPWQTLGEAQLQQAKLAAARASFRRGLAKNPHDWRLWLDLALASRGKARTAAARQALALNPLSPEMNRILPFLGLRL